MFDPDGTADGGLCLEQHDRSGEVNNMLYRKKEGGFRSGHVGKATMVLHAVLDVFRLQTTWSASCVGDY